MPYTGTLCWHDVWDSYLQPSVWQPPFTLVSRDRKIKYKARGFFWQCLETLLALSSPLYTSNHFSLPPLCARSASAIFSPQKANKRKKKIHYRSGLRDSFHAFSPVRTSRLLRILIWNGGTMQHFHVLRSLNREWGRKWICEPTDTRGLRKRGKVPEHTREQTVLVLFLW